jgi:hypothetical protein
MAADMSVLIRETSKPHYVMHPLMLYDQYFLKEGYAVAQLVEALRYKPECRGFDSRWSHWDFSVT